MYKVQKYQMLLDVPRIPLSLFCVLVVTCAVCIANGGIGLNYLRKWQADKSCAKLNTSKKVEDQTDDEKKASPYRPLEGDISKTQDGQVNGQFVFLLSITTLSSLLLIGLTIWLILRAISVGKDRRLFHEMIENAEPQALDKLRAMQPSIFGVNRMQSSTPSAGAQAGYYLSFLSVGLLFASSAATSISIFNQWKADTTCSSMLSPDKTKSRFLAEFDKNGRRFTGILFTGLTLFAIIPTLVVYTIIIIEKSKMGWTKLERAQLRYDRLLREAQVAKFVGKTASLRQARMKEILASAEEQLKYEKETLELRSKALAANQFRTETFAKRKMIAEQKR